MGSSGSARDAYGAQGKYAQAEALLSQALEIERRVSGPEHPATLNTLSGFASMYQRQSKYALAETYAAQALAGRRHALGTRIRWHRRPIWHWPTSLRVSSPKASPSRAKPWSLIARGSRMIGEDSGQKACWAPGQSNYSRVPLY
ncbi:MAG: tetratricopeptide repeat protein [Bryobacteraceae bacterium]